MREIKAGPEESTRNVPLISFIFSACVGVFISSVVLLVAARIAIATRKKREVSKKSKGRLYPE